MNGKFHVALRLIAIFVILVGVGGLFSSVWAGISDFIFSNGAMIPTPQACAKITSLGTSSQSYENVDTFSVEVNGTRYECANQAIPVNTMYSNLRWQVPGMFMFSLVIGFGVFLYRYSAKQEKQN